MISGTCHCGSVHVEIPRRPASVNMRNFEPEDGGRVRIKLLDGASTWKYVDCPTP